MLEEIGSDFRKNVESVHELVNFDRFVMDFAIEHVSRLHDRLSPQFANPADNGEHTLQVLKNVRSNDSLRHQYRLIANQGVVLLVSYFGSTVADIFRAAIPLVLGRGSRQLLREELRLTLDELVTLRAEPDSLGELFANKKDISFQDMQSIARAFKDYVGVDLSRDKTTNNVIAAQACRHVIVHSGGVADRRLARQVATAVPRDIKPDIREGQVVQFDSEELRVIGGDMVLYVDRLMKAVSGAQA